MKQSIVAKEKEISETYINLQQELKADNAANRELIELHKGQFQELKNDKVDLINEKKRLYDLLTEFTKQSKLNLNIFFRTQQNFFMFFSSCPSYTYKDERKTNEGGGGDGGWYQALTIRAKVTHGSQVRIPPRSFLYEIL